METDYREKIRKLLALAESPNEHEAKAALLKARELMAEHKLTEAELVDKPSQEVLHVQTSITCSKRKNPWIVELSAVIGENYCCKAYRTRRKGKQTCTVGFIGFVDDVEVCYMIFRYAVDCVLAETKRIRQNNSWRYGDEIARMCDSYGYGFARGVSEAFTKQQEQNKEGWGLVLVMPKEVQEAADSLGHGKFIPKVLEDLHGSYWNSGYRDGKEFDPKRRLEA